MAQQIKRKRRNVSGIILLDKPLGVSSNGALQKVRWLLNAAKGGHTGSLDPLATGVLPLCFGEATKFSRYLLDADKTYETVVQLGATTTTADAEGEVLTQAAVNCDVAQIETALAQFRGDILQVPPMYSALKKDGQPLYKLARSGQVVEREPRPVRIVSLERLAFDSAVNQLSLRVHCSKGTYIRTLAEDIGAALGCGAYVAKLRRTQAGPFTLEGAVTVAELEQLHEQQGAEALDQFLMACDSGLHHWPAISLTESSSYYWLQGQPVRAPGAPAFGMLRVRNAEQEFIGIGEIDEDGLVAPRRVIRTE